MKNNIEGLRFNYFVSENFKNLPQMRVDINGQSFFVVGKNSVGKSSLIQILTGAVDKNQLPEISINKDSERAKIEVGIGGTINGQDKKYIVEIYFTPSNKTGRLVVMNEQGEKIKTPATFLQSLIGNVSFDITGFLNAKKDKRIEMLKKLTGASTQIDLINVKITDKKAEKKAKKDRMESLEGSVENHGYSDAQIELFSTPAPVDHLQKNLAGMSKGIENYAKMEGKKKEFEDSIPKSKKIIEDGDIEITRLLTEIDRLNGLLQAEKNKTLEAVAAIEKAEKNLETCKDWFDKNPKPDSESLNQQIQAATEHNHHHQKLVKYGEQQKEINSLKNDILTYDDEIKKLEIDRGDVISKSQLPVKGLSFTDNEILLDGLPLESGQINTARIFEVGVQIAIAQNPNLKTIFLHHASLFDEENLKKVLEIAEEKGFQVIGELVESNKEVEIRFTESKLNEE